MKLDKTTLLLVALVLFAVALRFIGRPFGPWWVGLGGALVLVLVLIFWKRE